MLFRSGCPQCDIVFKKPLWSLLEKSHGKVEHVGKVPSRSGDEIARQQQLRVLRSEREKAVRKQQDLDAHFVVDTLQTFDSNDDADFCDALAKEVSRKDLEGYKFALVMEAADRNLQEIFVKERPDAYKTRALMHDVGLALRHLHEREIMHGDLKMLNVVRVGERLQLIDLDAAAAIDDEGWAGAKCRDRKSTRLNSSHW